MSSTPERPGDSDDPVVAEPDQVARDTEAIDVVNSTGAVPRDTEAVEREQRTVLVDDKVLANRETVRLPAQRRPPPGPRSRAPLPVAAAFATLWAALLSYLPVAAVIGLARTLEGSGGLAGAAHAGLAGWMLGHGVPIGTSIGALGLAPLLLSMLVVWRLNRAGLHVTRAVGARRTGSTVRALSVAFAIALSYSLLGSVLALVVDGKGTEVTPGRAALNFFLIGLAGALAGSLRGTDALRVWAGRLPAVLRHGVRTGVIAALLVLAAGAAVTGLSVALGGGQAADMISAYRTGVAGQAGITLVSLAYGVNGSVWAAAYLLGPGFALGTGSIVRLTEVTVGPLPTLPLLAGLPNGPMGAGGTLLLALPVLAGMAAGWLFTLRLIREAKQADGGSKEVAWSLVIGGGLIAGPVAGLLLGLAAKFSGGSLGDGRLATIGPDPWAVGLLAAVVLAVAAALGATAARMIRTPKA
ncbi:DUF6350 family protein [Actinoplanes sp. Pm04-4]|uniref:DUF6350 family protein n=1 Tax=Paractinoplanes pyxinae TaxID=2997416 RepID=A0ABT4AWX9_9ACTN|nr:DUF6350 family protein [Actinoplanes pyxinae]MCY1137925.1 DUF6350 family protein [Actinoplanes pyxinae]